ncbi:MAG TPA: hypothetical protein VFN85_01090 [Solirubrobacterales bacterium]|nr:hypothetical protein [Solirubrobacterales bacterium]
MGRLSAISTALTLALAAAIGLSACGGGGDANLLPGRTAAEINSNLDQVEQRVAAGDCVGAEDAVASVRTEIANLGGVDKKLKATLAEGADRLEEVVVGCEEAEPEETETTVEPTVEPEEAGTEKKPKKEKGEKEKPTKEPEEAVKEPSEEPEAAPEGPTLPPQANGKGEEKGGGPQTEAEPPATSGGVSPSVGVE